MQSWEAVSVFMNPPYTAPSCYMVNTFVDKFFDEEFMAGIVLVNNATETHWFCSAASARPTQVCFTDHRISFWNADGSGSLATPEARRSSSSGRNWKRPFRNQFAQHGKVVTL